MCSDASCDCDAEYNLHMLDANMLYCAMQATVFQVRHLYKCTLAAIAPVHTCMWVVGGPTQIATGMWLVYNREVQEEEARLCWGHGPYS